MKRIAAITSASLLASSLLLQPATAHAVDPSNLPAGIKGVSTTNYGFFDLVGNPFNEETNTVSWDLSLRQPFSASEPYNYTSDARMVIPQKVGAYNVAEPKLEYYTGISISRIPYIEGKDPINTNDVVWLSQLSDLRRALLRLDDATLAREMDTRLSQRPDWSIFLGSDQAWSNDTTTYGTQAINPSGTWTRLEAHNPYVYTLTNGETLLRDDEGNIIRVLSAIKPADGNTTVYYQKIPAEYLANFTNTTGETEENAFAQNASAILAMIDTTVYTTTLEEPLGGDDTLPTGTPYQGDLYQIANDAYNSMFQLLGDANNQDLITPEFVVNLTLMGQYIGEGNKVDLFTIYTGYTPEDIEELKQQYRDEYGATDEQIEELFQEIQNDIASLQANVFSVSETTDSNGEKWWIVDINKVVFGVMSTMTIASEVTRDVDAEDIDSPNAEDFATLDNGEWIPAQVYLSNACVRGEEDLYWNCVDALTTDKGSGLTTSGNTTRNPDVPTFNSSVSKASTERGTASPTTELTRGILAIAEDQRDLNLREGIFGNAYCMVTRNVQDPLAVTLTDSVATDFDNPFAGRQTNGIGTGNTFNAGTDYYVDSGNTELNVFNQLMWTDDACDQAAAPVGIKKAVVTSETETTSGAPSSTAPIIPVPIPVPTGGGSTGSSQQQPAAQQQEASQQRGTTQQQPTQQEAAKQDNRLLANTGASVTGLLAVAAALAALGATLLRRKNA